MAMNWNSKVAGRLLGRLAVASIGAALGALRKPAPQGPAAAAEPAPDARALEAIGKRFFRASFEVMGHLAKADGHISEAEIAAACGFMDELGLDEAGRREAIACFTRGKQPDYDYRAELTELSDICVAWLRRWDFRLWNCCRSRPCCASHSSGASMADPARAPR